MIWKLFTVILSIEIARAVVVNETLPRQEGVRLCTSGGCLNQGGCVETTCECSAPWTGWNCGEYDANAYVGENCGNYVCKNSASCIYQGEPAYINEDYPEFYDATEEPMTYDATEEPMTYDATEEPMTYCLCFGPWIGDDCGTHVCHKYCKNRGKCIVGDDGGSAFCQCPANITGARCQYKCEDHCVHASGCNEDNGRVYCFCLPGYSGERCEINLLPEIKAMTPGYGPVAGGTNITFRGSKLDRINVIFMTPYCTGRTPCTSSARISYSPTQRPLQTENMIEIISVNASRYGIQPNITTPVLYNISYYTTILAEEIPTKFVYEYRPNPIVLDIYPRRTFLGGGITLTAVGLYLDSVHSPVLYVYLERRSTSGDDYSVINTTTYMSTDIKTYNSSALLCKTPIIPLSIGDVNDITPQSRQRRQAEDTGMEINNEEREFYLGLGFDGVDTYRNMSETNPQAGRLAVYINPSFETFDETRSYDPKSEDFINIKGQSLTQGASKEDYRIELGQGTCELVDLTDNLIVCKPPDKEPNILKEGAYKNGEPRIYVNAGYPRFVIGHIDYVVDWTMIYIIVGCVAGALLLILLCVAICCCIRKSRKTNSKLKSSQRVNQHTPNADLEATDFPRIKR